MSTKPTNTALANYVADAAALLKRHGHELAAEHVHLAAHRLETMSLLLADCEKFLTEWIAEYGGCDHAVNVCSCAEQQLLLKVAAALNEGRAS